MQQLREIIKESRYNFIYWSSDRIDYAIYQWFGKHMISKRLLEHRHRLIVREFNRILEDESCTK